MRHLHWTGLCLFLAMPALAADDPPTPLEETVRFLGAIGPDEAAIDYLATIDPRTGRPKQATGSLQRGAWPARGVDARAVAQFGPRSERVEQHGAVQHVTVAPDGRTVAASHCSGTVQLFDAASGRPLHRLRVNHGRLGSFAFSPDSKLLATTGRGWRFRDAASGGVNIWDVVSGAQVHSLSDNTVHSAVAFTPDGRTLYASGMDGRLTMYDPTTGERRNQQVVSQLQMMAFTADGKQLAAVTEAGAFVVLDAADGKVMHTVPVMADRFQAFQALSPDGRRLAVGNGSSTYVFDLPGGKLLPLKFAGGRRQAFGGSPVAFSPDGKTLAIAAGSILLCDAATGDEQRPIRGGHVNAVAYSSHGKTLISGDAYGHVLIWDATPRTVEDYPRFAALSARELDTLGRDLRDERALRAYIDLLTLAAVPRAAAWHLRADNERPPAAAPDRIQQLIADLDGGFDQRQRAAAELAKLGDWAVVPLHRTLAAQPPLEVRRRIERLLDDLDPRLPGDHRLLGLHAVDLLESLRSPAARAVLERLADGAPGNLVTREAREALGRMKKAERGVDMRP